MSEPRKTTKESAIAFDRDCILNYQYRSEGSSPLAEALREHLSRPVAKILPAGLPANAVTMTANTISYASCLLAVVVAILASVASNMSLLL